MKKKKKSGTDLKSQLTATLFAWQTELCMDGDTLRRKLAKAEIKHEPRGLIRAREIIKALVGGKDEALIRKATAEAIAIERENKVADGLLVELPVAEKAIWQALLMPLKQELELMPEKLAALVSPENPEGAQQILQDWVEQIKKQIGNENEKSK